MVLLPLDNSLNLTKTSTSPSPSQSAALKIIGISTPDCVLALLVNDGPLSLISIANPSFSCIEFPKIKLFLLLPFNAIPDPEIVLTIRFESKLDNPPIILFEPFSILIP